VGVLKVRANLKFVFSITNQKWLMRVWSERDVYSSACIAIKQISQSLFSVTNKMVDQDGEIVSSYSN
jgi:hypothetical protein